MTSTASVNKYFIGWDVGGWNCDKNPRSRDAIVIVDADLAIVGQAWRGNLRRIINQADTAQEFVAALFSLCKAELPQQIAVTLAIDTPLGFSEHFVALITQYQSAGPIQNSSTNPYLFRSTEQFLFDHGLSPLSAIKDMIGSQATKGMHVLAKYTPQIVECGAWSGGNLLTIIEAYPSACKTSASLQSQLSGYSELPHEDCRDALICALIAERHARQRTTLTLPPESISPREGWIWIPRDILNNRVYR